MTPACRVPTSAHERRIDQGKFISNEGWVHGSQAVQVAVPTMLERIQPAVAFA
jgi:hypothetical protein